SPWCNRQHYGFWYRHSRFESWWGSKKNAATGYLRWLHCYFSSSPASLSSSAPDLSDLSAFAALPRLKPSLSAFLTAAALCAAVYLSGATLISRCRLHWHNLVTTA